MGKMIPINEMIVALAFELQAWKILYGTKEPLYYRQQKERILSRLELLHQYKEMGLEKLEEDFFTIEDEEQIKEHIDGKVMDQQKQEIREEEDDE